MSIRAYKVITKTLAKTSSFNLSHNPWIFDNLSSNFENNGESHIELEKEKVENKLKELSNLSAEEIEDSKLNTMTGELEACSPDEMKSYVLTIGEAIEVLNAILEDFDKDEDFVTYECY